MSNPPSALGELKQSVLRQLVTMWAGSSHSAGLRDDIEVAIAFVVAIRLQELTPEVAAPLIAELQILAGPDGKQLETRLMASLEALRDARVLVDGLYGPVARAKPRPSA